MGANSLFVKRDVSTTKLSSSGVMHTILQLARPLFYTKNIRSQWHVVLNKYSLHCGKLCILTIGDWKVLLLCQMKEYQVIAFSLSNYFLLGSHFVATRIGCFLSIYLSLFKLNILKSMTYRSTDLSECGY